MTDLSRLESAASSLSTRLEKLRQVPSKFEWYRYQSLSNVPVLQNLFRGKEAELSTAAGEGVLDLGCADGDLAFLFESLGCRVHAVDNPVTNHNAMRGVHALKSQLDSSVTIQELDVDSRADQISTVGGTDNVYGLALFLGTLYHLKNPHAVLEHVSKISRYCVISTRVARAYPGGEAFPPHQPVAYLLGETELNADNSNYWIFSPPALERLCERTHWRILEKRYLGAADSDPVKNDERAFYLLKSCYGLRDIVLGEGWHEIEKEGWRWTKPSFSLTLDNPLPALKMELYIPEALLEQGPVTLSCSANGSEVTPAVYAEPGQYTFARRLPKSARVELKCSVDRRIAPSALDPREFGLIVSKVAVTD